MQLHADSFEIQAANLFNGNEVGILFSTFNCSSQAGRQHFSKRHFASTRFQSNRNLLTAKSRQSEAQSAVLWVVLMGNYAAQQPLNEPAPCVWMWICGWGYEWGHGVCLKLHLTRS